MADDLEPGTSHAPVAIFPLPEVTLFPGCALPLHVFEPRYRAMTEDVLAGDGRLVIVQIASTYPIDAHGHPRVASIAGLGHIDQHRRRSDGRFDLVVVGRARVELRELPFDPPYRRVRATVLGEQSSSLGAHDVALLLATAARSAAALGRGPTLEALNLASLDDPARIVDRIAAHLVASGKERQRLLEILDVAERVRACTAALLGEVALGGSEPRTLN